MITKREYAAMRTEHKRLDSAMDYAILHDGEVQNPKHERRPEKKNIPNTYKPKEHSMNAELVTICPEAERFAELMTAGIEAWLEAGQLYVKTIDKSPDKGDDFRQACPNLPAGAWKRFEAIGRGWLLPQLAMSGNGLLRHLKELPPSQQKQAMEHGVAVLVADKEHRLLKAQDMAPAQLRQVFAGDHTRDLTEQQRWILNQRPPNIKRRGKGPYTVKRGKVYFNEPREYNRVDLLRILQEMEG